jgi:hypothetical protein
MFRCLNASLPIKYYTYNISNIYIKYILNILCIRWLCVVKVCKMHGTQLQAQQANYINTYVLLYVLLFSLLLLSRLMSTVTNNDSIR